MGVKNNLTKEKISVAVQYSGHSVRFSPIYFSPGMGQCWGLGVSVPKIDKLVGFFTVNLVT